MYRSPQVAIISRRRFQICKIVIATSLVWFMIDVFLLTYFTDCNVVTKSDNCPDKLQVNRSEHFVSKTDPPAEIPAKTGFRETPAVRKNSPLPRKPKSGRNLSLRTIASSEPGDGGRPVVIPEGRENEMKELFKINQFNLLASDLMSLNRSLPDYRMDACRKKNYPVDDLPDTSIVIVFHNEAWTTLLRTIWSIITRSPRRLVREIILVDDASEKEFLKEQLEDYVAKLPVSTFVIRMGARTGLIRARLRGATQAKGKVITFLDAHCECTEGWLEPLLHEIYKNRTSVVCPIIDVISDDNFEYITGSHSTWGGFNWRLSFRWYGATNREIIRRGGDHSQPMRTPAMAGGLLSIDRSYFYEIGAYDPGMDIWGGENIEMSFRIWMCGGQILIVTCSRVGHVFRKVSPYSWPGGVERILNRNSRRTAEVWMDQYKDFVYKSNPGMLRTEYGDIAERAELRQNLKCHSFKWYLENIYPESWIPAEFHSLGSVKHKDSGLCLDLGLMRVGDRVLLEKCNQYGPSQVFAYTSKQELSNDEHCLDATRTGPVQMITCHRLGGNQQWHYDKENFSIRHVTSNMCLDKPSPKEPRYPKLEICSGRTSQKWVIQGLDLKNYRV